MPTGSLTVDDLDQLVSADLRERNRSNITDDEALRRLTPEVEEAFTNLRRRATSWTCGALC